jgi:RNA polymerase sigma-70 factor (ECF subfamily)
MVAGVVTVRARWYLPRVRSDLELAEAWAAGDRAAGDELFARHFDAIYRFFSRKVHGDVSDLVQRTFLGLTEARERFRGEASIRTFLFVVARRELFHHFAAKRREAALDFSVSSLRDLAPSPSSMLRRNDERAMLAEALRAIPVDLQIALELHYWEDMKGPQIAEVLGVPEGTVRSRLRRGLEALRAELARLAGEPRESWKDEDALDGFARASCPYD